MKFPNFSFEKKLWSKGFKFVAGVDEVGRGAFAGPVVAGVVVFPSSFDNETMKQCSNGSIEINDSKKLTFRKREIANEWIRKNALVWGIGQASVTEINHLGMTKATQRAFRRAVSQANYSLSLRSRAGSREKQSPSAKMRLPRSSNSLAMTNNADSVRIDFLLIDAFYIPYVRGIKMPCKRHRQRRIVSDNCNQLAIIHGDEKSFSIAAASIIAKVYRDELMLDLSCKHQKYRWKKNKGYGTREHQKAIHKWGLTRHHRKQFVETFLKKNS